MSESNPFLDVLAAAGITVEQFNEKTKDMSPYDKGHEKIKMIVDFKNGPDPGMCIYYPWFWKNKDASKPSGVGLSFFDAGGGYSITDVPARLKYRTRELAEEAGREFISEYEEFLLASK